MGTALDRKGKKKSFLVTYFPKLLLAPVPPAWLPPFHPPAPEPRAAVWHRAVPVRHGLSGSTSGQPALV